MDDLTEAYRCALQQAGMSAGRTTISVARTFFRRFGVTGWAELPLDEQCVTPLKDRRVVGWLLATGRMRASADYLVLARPYLGDVATRHHRVFFTRFRAVAAELGFDDRATRLQWSAITKICVLAGVPPDRLGQADLDAGRDALLAALARHRPHSHGRRALTTALFGAEASLFHAGVIEAPPRRQRPDQSEARADQWQRVPPQMASTLLGYVEQTRLSLRPATMVRIEGVLREFALFTAEQDPGVRRVADLQRRHVEAYKLHLAARPSARGGGLSKISLAEHLGCLRTCFGRVPSSGVGERPPRRPRATVSRSRTVRLWTAPSGRGCRRPERVDWRAGLPG
jgi:hypothetical protein